jgi:hypothetical protein
MKTEDLIAALAADTRPGPAPWPGVVQALMLSLPLSLGAMLAILGLRADPAAALQPLVALKTLLPLGLGALALAVALRQVRPSAPVRALARLLWAGPVVLGMAALWVLATTPPASWAMQFTGKGVLVCLVSIPSLAILPLAGLLWALRRGAALDPAGAGFAAGLAAGAFAAALYSAYCMEDSPLFYGTWYTLGVLIVAALGAVLGSRVLRF